jgi:ferrous iron transport protein A
MLIIARIKNHYHYGGTLPHRCLSGCISDPGTFVAVMSNVSQTVSQGFLPLSLMKKGDRATVTGIRTPESEEQRAVQLRLRELGFVPGEQVRIVAVSFPGNDPIAVRLGNTTFALRRHEAAMVHVHPL